MALYRKKPVTVEAVQWFKHGDHPAVEQRLLRFIKPIYQTPCKHDGLGPGEHGEIETLEGRHIVCPGDWIIKGIKDELYPCKPDIFEETYELVEDKI